MKDVVGATVHVGQVVTYPGRWGSRLFINVGVVRNIEVTHEVRRRRKFLEPEKYETEEYTVEITTIEVQRIEDGKLGKTVTLQRPDRLTVATMGVESLLA